MIHEDLGEGVHPITPVSCSWVVNKYTGIQARRTGFFLLPDFGSTAHMIQGQTLGAVLCDALEASAPTTSEQQVAGYVGYSRVKTLAGIWVLQPFWARLPTARSWFPEEQRHDPVLRDLVSYLSYDQNSDPDLGARPRSFIDAAEARKQTIIQAQ